MKRSIAAWAGGLLVMAALLAGCRDQAVVQESSLLGGGRSSRESPETLSLPDGTRLNVRLTSSVSSAGSEAGEDWDGVLADPVIVGDRVALHEGSVVRGVVQRADSHSDGRRATLELAITGVEEDGEMLDLDAGTEPIVAGTSRARHIGAIAGGAAAGALLGKVVTGSGKGALVGGLLGGAAGHYLSTRDTDVEIRPGTVLTFTVREQTATL